MSFFYNQAPIGTVLNRNQRTTALLHKKQCDVCPLNKVKVSHGKMQPTGTTEPLLYVLGEAPGKEEDKKGEPFVGKSGKFIRDALVEAQYPIDGRPDKPFVSKHKKYTEEFCRFNNTIRTHPEGNRDPDFIEIECCRPSVTKDIEECKPKGILLVGKIARDWVVQHNEGIYAWRGRIFPVQIGSHKCWAMAIFHPAFLLRKRAHDADSGDSWEGQDDWAFRRDIKNFLKYLQSSEYIKPHIEPVDSVMEGIRTVTGHDKKDIQIIREHLEWCSEQDAVAFDIETNGLRPYVTGSKILTVAVGTDEDTLAFPLEHKGAGWSDRQREIVTQLFVDFLFDSECVKIAHNLPFELEWLGVHYSEDIIRATKWSCTMAQAYILDSRKGMWNLDTLCVLHFGLHLKELSRVDVRNLANEPLQAVLDYNGLDTKYEFVLNTYQAALIKDRELTGLFKEQVRRLHAAVLTQLRGVPIDQDECRRHEKSLEKQEADALKQMRKRPEVKEFESEGQTYNPGSHKDNVHLFRDIIGWQGFHKEQQVQGEWTEKKYPLNKEVLERLDADQFPMAPLILQWREATGLLSKFVRPMMPGFEKGTYIFPDGRIHPQFNMSFTFTRRSSSEDPNGQNFPKRKFSFVRSELKAPKGWKFLSIDYGQIEARVICMASQDKTYVDALWKDFDIHMHWTEKLAKVEPSKVGGKAGLKDKAAMKDFRTAVKNEWTFPLFYGAVAKSVSSYLHIDEAKLEPLIDEFWDMFPGVLNWQKSLFKQYKKKGFVQSLTGFYYREPLRKNQRVNYPIQGTASDMCVDAWNRLSELADETGEWHYQPVLNIHDDLTFLIPDSSETPEIIETIIHQMLDMRHFDFVNVPILAEATTGPDLYNMEPVGDFRSDEWEGFKHG